MTSPSIQVAIIGGGLAGTVLMNALTRHPALDTHLYEANPEFKERGASVGLSVNARRALALLGLGDILKKAKAVTIEGSRITMGPGPKKGTRVIDQQFGLEIVHRASLLRELMSTIPKNKLHVGKRLARLDRKDPYSATLHFEDGSSVDANVVIGADGIHSSVRKFLLGEGHPAVEPVFAGFWDCRAIVPSAEAVAKVGDRVDLKEPRQNMCCGDGCIIYHDVLDDGENVCIVVGGLTPPDWSKESWRQSVSRSWLNDLYQDWGEFGRSMIDLLCGDEQEKSTFVQWESAKAPKLYDGPVVMIGDAAHAVTPWQGSGLAMAIEDSLILQTVLGKCKSVHDVQAAFGAYEHLMKPRGDQLLKSSHETGMILMGAHGLDPEVVHRELFSKFDFILEWDTEGAVKEAVEWALSLKRGALELLNTLKALDKRIIVVTEGPEDARVWTVEQLGVAKHIDFLATTNRFGVSKVDGLLRKVMKRLDVDANDMVFVGDNWARDMGPAMDEGVYAVYYAETEDTTLDKMPLRLNTLEELQFLVKGPEDGYLGEGVNV